MKTLYLSLILSLFLASCATQQTESTKNFAPKATEKQTKEFKEGFSLYRAHKFPEALKLFIKFLQSHNANEYTDDATYFIGQIYYEQADYFKAYRYWNALIETPYKSEYLNRSIVGAAQSQALLGHTDEALFLISKFNILPEPHEWLLNAQALELSSRLKLLKNDSLGSLKDLMLAQKYKKTSQEKQALLFKAEELIKNQIPQKHLETLLDDPDYSILNPAIRFKLGVFYYEQKSWPAAKSQFDFIKTTFPKSEYASKASEYIAFIDSQEKISSNTIGVVLPLSGKYKEQGYKILRGIEMAAHVFDASSALPIKLAVIDSEGSPELARKAVDRLMTEDHVIAIIGDIAARTSRAVALRAQELGIPCITLSQKQGLTEIGNYIFRNNLTPVMQMRALVDYAMKVRGYKKFAILFPNDSYGTEYATAFWDYVLLNGGQISGAQSYPPEETDFRHAIQRLVGTFYVEEDRGKEFALRLNEWKKTQNPKTARENPPKELLPPIVDFDGIFIPDNPKTLGQIAPMLAYNEVNNLPLLGTNIWNTPQTLERATKFAENTLFVDEFFSEDLNNSIKKFSTDFQSIFSYKPDIFETQGFDSLALILSALQNGGSNSRQSMREALAKSSKVLGATGPLSMNSSRDVEKNLIPLTVHNGQIVKADNQSTGL